MKRTFESLTPQEALHVAIFIEERNSELYHRYAEMFVEFRDIDSLQIAGVFWDMAVEERHHSSLLQERYTERYGQAACSVTEEDLQDMVELPKLEDGDVFDSQDGTIGPRERALQVALQAEHHARAFYSGLIERCSDPALRRVYRELAEFENNHVEFLERKLSESPSEHRPI